MKRIIHVLLLMALFIGYLSGLAYAQQIEVKNNNDSGTESLRQAVLEATEGTTIVFDPSISEITLTSQIDINLTDLTIDARDKRVTIKVDVPGTTPSRLFSINGIGNGTITFKNIDMKGGKLAIDTHVGYGTNSADEVENDCNGGAIYINNPNNTLYLENVTIQQSIAANGGAVYTKGNINIKDSKFYNNEAEGTGPKQNGSPLGFDASAGGGAIRAWGNVVIEGICEFSDNKITTYSDGYKSRGGAVFADGTLAITGSDSKKILFSKNIAISAGSEDALGGALYARGDVDLSYVEFTQNEANPEDDNRGVYPRGFGGAISAEGELDVKFADFNANTTYYSGGAIYCTTLTEPISIYKSQFNANKSGHGGAVYLLGVEVGKSVARKITDCTFNNNSADGNIEAGGAIAMTDFSEDDAGNLILVIENTTFSENISDGKGGAVYMGASNDKIINLTLTNCEYRINSATTEGGAVYLDGNDDITLNIDKGSLFHGNTALEKGGAIYTHSWGGTISIQIPKEAGKLVSFTGNEAGEENGQYGTGGAIYIGGTENAVEFDINAAFVSNKAHDDNGAGIYVQTTDGKGINGVVQSDSYFKENIAGWVGGGIYIHCQYWDEDIIKPTLTIHGNTTRSEAMFFKNEATEAMGGAISMFGDLTITDATFDENSSGDGGAIKLYSINSTDIVDFSFENVTFKNNISTTTSTSEGGGALSLEDTQGTILNSTFFNNTSGSRGGAIYSKSSSVTIDEGVLFDTNSAKEGGAIYSYSLESSTGSGMLIIEGGATDNSKVVFRDNQASGFAGSIYMYLGETSSISNTLFTSTKPSNINAPSAGAILNSSIDLRLDNVKIEKMNTSSYGGAIYNNYGKITINNSEIIQNYSLNGGGIFNKASLIMTNVYVLKNGEDTSNGKGETKIGGGLYNNTGGSAHLTNVLFAENHAINGGGIYNYSTIETPIKLTNVTIANNTGTGGNGIYDNKQSSVAISTSIIQNSIIWKNGNASSNIYNATNCIPKYYNSLVEGLNDTTNDNLDGTSADNDPKFNIFQITPDPLLADYALQPGSRAIDSGKDEYFPTTIPQKDITGITDRIIGNKIDMGAYESAKSGPTVEFDEDGDVVCQGSSGSLKIKLGGTGPWIISYKKDNAAATSVKVKATDVEQGIYTLRGLEPGKYTLESIKEGPEGSETAGTVIGQVEAIITSVAGPSVADISGGSEVFIGESIQLSNTTPDGYWYSEDGSYATVDQSGNVTGVAEGTVDIWYAVTGAAPTNCETIKTHTVTIKKKEDPKDPDPEDPDPEDPDPDPDPDPWPPVVPEPDPDPDPNPNAWIIVRPNAAICFTDEFFNVSFDLLYKDKPLVYAIAFTNASKAAGFEDIKTYKDLPADRIISIPVPKNVKPGTYAGYIVLREKGSEDLDMYPFRITILDGTRITRHPESVTGIGEDGKFRLSVEAIGDNLTYQWFHNGVKIPGATSATYEAEYSSDKEGVYYAEVYGDCGWDQSDDATVSGCFTALIKWTDVLYVKNTDNRYERFQWYKNGQAITTYGTSIYYTDPAGLEGSYSVRAYKKDGSYDEGCAINFSSNTKASAVSVYPTVVNRNNTINIESNEVGESYLGALVEMFNLSGQRVYAEKMNSAKLELPMNQPTGVYLIQITTEKGRKTLEKVIVK